MLSLKKDTGGPISFAGRIDEPGKIWIAGYRF